MSLEGQKGSDKNNRSGIVEATAFATALLGALDHGPVQAMEMPQGMSWEQGVGERMRGAVMKEPRENGAIYIRLPNGESYWPSSYKGEVIRDGDDSATVRILSISQAEIDYLSKYRGVTVEARCTIHTHPDAFKFTTVSGENYSPQFKPPSAPDVQKTGAEDSFRRMYNIMHIGVKDNLSAVADNRGLWYFKTSNKDTFDPASVKKWENVYGNFIGRSYFDRNFNFETEYQKLRQAYQEYLGADVRFVSYNDIGKEPPCAGVDYKKTSIEPNYDVKINQPVAPSEKKGPEMVARPAGQTQPDVHVRSDLGELDHPQIRRRLGGDEPQIIEVGPPQR